jgi:cold shock CspA family protein
LEKGIQMQGEVKGFDSSKAIGFIIQDEGTPDASAHHSGIESEGFKNLKERDEVQVDIAESVQARKSPAVNVKVLSA